MVNRGFLMIKRLVSYLGSLGRLRSFLSIYITFVYVTLDQTCRINAVTTRRRSKLMLRTTKFGGYSMT